MSAANGLSLFLLFSELESLCFGHTPRSFPRDRRRMSRNLLLSDKILLLPYKGV